MPRHMQEADFLEFKSAQDSIKVTQDLIKTYTETLLARSGGVDWSSFVPFNAGAATGSVPINSTIVLWDTTGKGFLKKANFCLTTSGTVGIRIRVTLDGIVRYDSGTNGVGYTIGVATHEFITQLSTSAGQGLIDVSDKVSRTYEPSSMLTDGVFGNNKCTILASPLFFNQSCLVELISGSGSANQGRYDVLGGLL